MQTTSKQKDIYNLRLFYTRHKHTSIKTISYARFQRLKCPAPYQRELTALGAAVRWGTRPSPATRDPPASDKCLMFRAEACPQAGIPDDPPNAKSKDSSQTADSPVSTRNNTKAKKLYCKLELGHSLTHAGLRQFLSSGTHQYRSNCSRGQRGPL